MANELILLDTSILIDYFRKKNKKNSIFYQLVAAKRYVFAVSVITEYEIYVGATEDQKELKRNNKMIAIPDLLIGATAKNRGLRIATKNVEHFKRIADLQIMVIGTRHFPIY